jgi:hypothetical protein
MYEYRTIKQIRQHAHPFLAYKGYELVLDVENHWHPHDSANHRRCTHYTCPLARAHDIVRAQSRSALLDYSQFTLDGWRNVLPRLYKALCDLAFQRWHGCASSILHLSAEEQIHSLVLIP